MGKWKFIKILVFISIFIIASFGVKGGVVENLNIPRAIGYDIQKNQDTMVQYIVPIEVYTQNGMDFSSKVDIGIANNIGETRENRQLKANKKFLLGLEKAILINEEQARFGIDGILDILIDNPQINDRATVAICKQKATDILNYRTKDIKSATEYIDGMIENSYQYNFLAKHYTVIDTVIRSGLEGVNMVIPYVEINNNNIEITGLAIFNKDKMVLKTNIDDMKIINLLRENKVYGILTLQENSKQYINYYARSKRKVKCEREGDKYRFIIDLNLNGDIISNELYENMRNNNNVIEEFKNNMALQVEAQCNDLINKMKKEYKMDIINLGKVAAAKYGKGTGEDWNKVVCNSDILVNVKVKIDKEGRGSY
ncbi:Ger(x)C family spore germination protein [Clostridium rectalis]|uniref:Ger(x)C family spore germination protein n=1 Tax=Clostridium rectalis TaxID=2040295 RepID=UPI000F643A25|nr:Ger(x)C family spore germination protein [Clostridium rectalis]